MPKTAEPTSTDSQYRRDLMIAWQVWRLVQRMPLEEMVDAIGTAEALGPILDPTLYGKNGEAMQEDKQLLEALQRVKAVNRRPVP